MPFTFSHPAIVLPLACLPKKWISLTGLVAGSMAPDFEYFLRMRVSSLHSHTIAGMFWFDLPIALIAAFLFHSVARNSFIGNLPFFLKARLAVFTHFNWNAHFLRSWPVVIASAVIGSASHLFWDSFTHEHGFFVERWEALQNSLLTGLPLYKILQHGSTLVGGMAIAVVVTKLPADNTVSRGVRPNYWLMVSGTALSVFALRLFFTWPEHAAGNMVVTGIAAGMTGIVAAGLFVRTKGKPAAYPGNNETRAQRS